MTAINWISHGACLSYATEPITSGEGRCEIQVGTVLPIRLGSRV